MPVKYFIMKLAGKAAGIMPNMKSEWGDITFGMMW
jgi:hypothetical protein